MSEQGSRQPPQRADGRELIVSGALGGAIAGLLIAARTLQLNPYVASSIADSFVLLIVFAALYGGLATLCGCAVAAVLFALRRTRATRPFVGYLVPILDRIEAAAAA